MPTPSGSDLHVDQLLTDLSIGFMQDPAGFVADKVFPTVPTSKRSNRYASYDREDFARDTFQKRAGGTEAAGGGWKIKNDNTYYCDRWSLKKPIDYDTEDEADEVFNLKSDATNYLSQQALINREKQWASNFFATDIWGKDYTGVAASPVAGTSVLQWNDANATPITDVKEANDVIHLASLGYRGNKLVVGRQVWTQLSEHPDLVARIQYSSSNTSPAMVSRQAAAALMELDELLVMDGVVATSDESATFESGGTITTEFIGGKSALLVYAAPRPSKMQPSGGYTFSWTGRRGAGAMGQRIRAYEVETTDSYNVEMDMWYDQKLVAAGCGAFFGTIVA